MYLSFGRINRIRLEFKVNSFSCLTAAISRINRIRLEFKGDDHLPIHSSDEVLIESDWNLKNMDLLNLAIRRGRY